jgi:UDP-N-acetylglucosamine 4-epimerase
LRSRLAPRFPRLKELRPTYRDFQKGDVRHSHADIGRARELLEYNPTHDVEAGLTEALDWYIEDSQNREASELRAPAPAPASR